MNYHAGSNRVSKWILSIWLWLVVNSKSRFCRRKILLIFNTVCAFPSTCRSYLLHSFESGVTTHCAGSGVIIVCIRRMNSLIGWARDIFLLRDNRKKVCLCVGECDLGSNQMLWSILMKYFCTQVLGKILIELAFLLFERHENKNIFYIHETWVDKSLTFGKCWRSDDVPCVLKNSSSSNRLNVVHTWSKKGFSRTLH